MLLPILTFKRLEKSWKKLALGRILRFPSGLTGSLLKLMVSSISYICSFSFVI
uniref:Uncharacterized protein n=1 Tax=Helianthus annuus TaxID=4232 RepID=A0A251SFB1_HELAN